MRDHADVRRLLPQRYPLLLVDRVVEFRPGHSIRATKAISGTDPCFANVADGAQSWHYAYPRSLMIESFGQSAALLWLAGATLGPSDDDPVLMFIGASDYQFFGSAYPGDVLRHDVRLDSVIADTAFASGETWVGDRLVSTVTSLIATRRPVRGSASVAQQRADTPSATVTDAVGGHATSKG